MKLYLIRHGQTVWNAAKRLQGSGGSPLNDQGRAMARQAAAVLKPIPLDLCFTSPLLRARETAELLLEGRQVPILDEPRLQELGFGDYEGLYFGEDNLTIPDRRFVNLDCLFHHPERYPTPPHGETIEALIRRVGGFLRELEENPAYGDKHILISTHCCALSALLANVDPVPTAEFWSHGRSKNCELTVVEQRQGRLEIVHP